MLTFECFIILNFMKTMKIFKILKHPTEAFYRHSDVEKKANFNLILVDIYVCFICKKSS